MNEFILPNYVNEAPVLQLKMLEWVKDNLELTLKEIDEQEKIEDLLDSVKNAELIRGKDGFLHKSKDIYSPANEELIKDLFGDRFSFPDMNFYSEKKSSWMAFFRRLGMLRLPNPQHLVSTVTETAESEEIDNEVKDSDFK